MMKTEILQQLNDAAPFEKRQTLENLAVSDCAGEYLNVAAQLLGDKDRGVRDAAAQFLILQGSESAAREIVHFITSDDITIRNLAGNTLVKIGAPAVRPLLPYLDSEDKNVRKFAVDVLAQLPAQEAIDAIASHLNDPDPNVVTAVVDALGMLNGRAYADELLACYDNAPYLRYNILSTLSGFGEDRFLPLFKKALDDEDPVVQLAAAEALVRTNHPEVLPLLISRVDVVNAAARSVLLHSIVTRLMELPPETRQPLPPHFKKFFWEMLDDVDPVYLVAALKGLSLLNGKEHVEKLIDKIGISPETDEHIFQLLKNSGIQTLSFLLKAAEENRITVPKTARFLIALMAEYAKTDEYLDQNSAVRRACKFVNANFHYLDIETKIGALRVFAGFSLPHLNDIIVHALEDMEVIVRSQALEVVAAKGVKQYIGLLQTLKNDEDEFIRDQVMGLLAKEVN